MREFDPSDPRTYDTVLSAGTAPLDPNVAKGLKQYAELKSVAYKTVEIFSGITRKPLFLKEAKTVGTDGHEIRVPLKEPGAYLGVEECLAHILFKSSAEAKRLFCSDYALRISAVAESHGTAIDLPVLERALNDIVATLDRPRVIGLWGRLYRGSTEQIIEKDRAAAAELEVCAHMGMVPLLRCLAVTGDAPAGELDTLRPVLEQALEKVRGRGFSAVLGTAKWLFSNAIKTILEETPPAPKKPPENPKDEEEAPEGTQAENPYTFPKGTPSGEGVPGHSEDGSAGGPGGDLQMSGSAGPGEIEEGEADTAAGAALGSGSKNTRRDFTREERLAALEQLLQKMGKLEKDGYKLEPGRFSKGNPQDKAIADEALTSPTTDEERFDDFLDTSLAEMEDVVDEALEALARTTTHDAHLKKDAQAKVHFVDSTKPAESPLSPEDQAVVTRLRSRFHRVMGRRKTRLEHAGHLLDIPALLTQRLAHIPGPVFRAQTRGQGFRVLLLLDRSGSMAGSKTAQTERAARILSAALRFPFVQLEIWGFTAHEGGSCVISRYDSSKDFCLGRAGTECGGFTPIPIALQVARKRLSEGSEKKALIILTDGLPMHSNRAGLWYGKKSLMLQVREEVLKTREHGINVVGVLLGSQQHGKTQFEVTDQQLEYMYGPKRHWTKLEADTLHTSLVRMVSSSFVRYLRGR